MLDCASALYKQLRDGSEEPNENKAINFYCQHVQIIMPNRAPSYYHWSQDKPCTTNDVYGYYLKGYVEQQKTTKAPTKKGPFDYMRPFSSSGFFPAIADPSQKSYQEIRLGGKRPCPSYCPPSTENRLNLRRGYTMGYTPISSRVTHSDVPKGVSLSRTVSAPAPYSIAEPKGKDLYLWHALAGSLVHTKNYKPACQVDQYVVPKKAEAVY